MTYDRPTSSWWGFWKDKAGYQIGDAVFGQQRDNVLIQLGEVKQDRYDSMKST